MIEWIVTAVLAVIALFSFLRLFHVKLVVSSAVRPLDPNKYNWFGPFGLPKRELWQKELRFLKGTDPETKPLRAKWLRAWALAVISFVALFAWIGIL